ncbi:MAG: DUF5677 domain-containing protein [Reichenbachiella sp.]|uniref:DUF5677 domain-containing protein n=1 Tax=Reichenbachiella sp. TaxID=2184521 RepID=UPI0032999BD9
MSPSDSQISLNKLLRLTDSLVDKIPKNSSEYEILLYAYFISLHDLADDINFLFKNKRYNGLPVLARSFLETYVDFRLLSLDVRFANSLILKAYKEHKNVINSILDWNQVDEKERVKLIQQLNTLTECINERIDFEESEFRVDTIKEKFKKLDLLWLHRTAYNELCAFAHNRITIIEQKHIEKLKANTVVLKHKVREEFRQLELVVSLTVTYLTDTIKIIEQKTNLDCSDILNSI